MGVNRTDTTIFNLRVLEIIDGIVALFANHDVVASGEDAKNNYYFNVGYDEQDDMWLDSYSTCPKGKTSDKCVLSDAGNAPSHVSEAFEELKKLINSKMNEVIDRVERGALSMPNYYGGDMTYYEGASFYLKCDNLCDVQFTYSSDVGVEMKGNMSGLLSPYFYSDDFLKIVDLCMKIRQKPGYPKKAPAHFFF